MSNFLAKLFGLPQPAQVPATPQPVTVTTKAPELSGNGALLKHYDLQVRHFHGDTLLGYPRQRSMTVAYRDEGSTIAFATAIVHPKDKFCRKDGTKLAVASFVNGDVVRVPKVTSFTGDRRTSAHETLTSMFGF